MCILKWWIHPPVCKSPGVVWPIAGAHHPSMYLHPGESRNYSLLQESPTSEWSLGSLAKPWQNPQHTQFPDLNSRGPVSCPKLSAQAVFHNSENFKLQDSNMLHILVHDQDQHKYGSWINSGLDTVPPNELLLIYSCVTVSLCLQFVHSFSWLTW